MTTQENSENLDKTELLAPEGIVRSFEILVGDTPTFKGEYCSTCQTVHSWDPLGKKPSCEWFNLWKQLTQQVPS